MYIFYAKHYGESEGKQVAACKLKRDAVHQMLLSARLAEMDGKVIWPHSETEIAIINRAKDITETRYYIVWRK